MASAFWLRALRHRGIRVRGSTGGKREGHRREGVQEVEGTVGRGHKR